MLLRYILLFAFAPAVIFAAKLNKFINHYDVLTYDPAELHEKHERARRSIQAESDVHLDFNAHGRHFKLRLKRNAPHLSPTLVVESSQGERHLQPDYLYTGKLEDEERSYSHGAILNGVFRGTIYDKGESYYVEPESLHFEQPQEFHSVIYKGSDVNDPNELGSCGGKTEILEKMKKFAETGEEESQGNVDWNQKSHQLYENKYASPNNRRKRSLGQQCSGGSTSCNLFLQSDHTFTRYYAGRADSTDMMIIENAVIAALNDHVSAVNAIYNPVDFGSGCINVGFSVDRIRINGTDELGDQSNPFRNENIGVEKFLELNSLQNHDDYCLAYIFADRDFNDGVLGLAWVGSTGSTSGGICEVFKRFSGGISQSLNTGIVTIQNYGSHVPSKVSHITFAHELGHNFGSPHDYPSTCRPGDGSSRGDGNFIMYASATSGDKVNNNKFSECSRKNMTQVVSSKGGCFVESDRAVCGNRIVDPGEECDCGYEDQCQDTCCTPRRPGIPIIDDPDACKLKVNSGVKVQCSPSQGPCCNSATCAYIPATSLHECRAKSECSSAKTCNGLIPACPNSDPVPDMTECSNNKQVCLAGECSGSICLKFQLEECYCDPPATDKDEEDFSCHLCCLTDSMDESSCMSSLVIDAFKNHTAEYGEKSPYDETDPKLVLWQQPGAPCNEFRGYCDVFYKCRDVDSNGPLSRLTQAILNPELYQNIADWIRTNWWAALLIALGIVILMAIFIQICSVHTPSSNPNLPKHRQLTLPRSRSRANRQNNRTNNLEMA